VRTCARCQQENEDGTQFCSACGAYLGWTTARRRTPSPPASPDPAAEPPVPAAVDRAKVNVVELGRSLRAEPDTAPDAAPDPEADLDPEPAVFAREPGRSAPEPPSPQEPAPATLPSASSAAPAAAAPAGAAAPKHGEVGCRVCGRPNASTRRFCRHCGTPLADLSTAAAARTDVAQRPEPWYRRLRGGDRRTFDRRMRSVSKGARIQYSRALGLRAQVVRALMLLGAFGLGVSFIGPWSRGARDWVDDTTARVLPGAYEDAAIGGLTVVPEQPADPDYLPSHAVDREPTRAWGVSWVGPAGTEPPPPCGQAPSAAAATLQLTFAQPVAVDRVTIQAGIDPANAEATRQVRPRTVDILFSDGQCYRAVLEDRFDPQPVDVDVLEATGAELRVVDGYPALDGPGDLATLGELTFSHRTR